MKKNMTGNRKFNRRRFVAAAGAGLTAAAVLITAVLGRSIEAEAADDTLIGIEKLRARVKESGKEFVVLEIVPDRAAAEIGFLFKDLEPILSEWDKEAMEWNKWENILCSLPSFEERFQFVQGKKEELKEYYAQIGLKSAFPVTVEDGDYVENDGPASGFRKITSDSVKRTGWFEKVDSGKGDYQVAFNRFGLYEEDGTFDKDVLYYTVSGDPVPVAGMEEDELENISPDTFVYYKTTTSVDGDIYILAGTWEDVQEQALMSIMSQSDDDEEQDDSEQSDDEDDVDKDSKDGDNSEDVEDGDNEAGEDDGNGGDGSDTDDGTDNGEVGDNGDVDGGSTGDGNGESDNTDGGNGESDNIGDENGEGSGNSDEGTVEGGGTTDTGGSEENGNEQGGDGNNDGDRNDAGQDNDIKEDGVSETDPTVIASIPLSININQGKWFLLVEDNPADDLDNQKTSEDTGSDNTGVDNTDTGNMGSDHAGSEDTGSDNAGSDDTDSDSDNTGSDNVGSDDTGSDNTGSDDQDSDHAGSDDSNSEEPGDDAGYADDMDSDDEDVDREDVEDGEGEEDDDEDDKTPAKDVFANEETPREYYFVQFERYKQEEGIYVYSVGEIVESSNGQYIFHECEASDGQEGVTYQTYTFPGRTIYCKNTFKSNEWFRKYVINMEESDYEDFPVKVLTLTPQELNEMEQLPNFDFLYLNSGLRAWGTPGGNVADSGSSEGGSVEGGGSEGESSEGEGSEGEGGDEGDKPVGQSLVEDPDEGENSEEEGVSEESEEPVSGGEGEVPATDPPATDPEGEVPAADPVDENKEEGTVTDSDVTSEDEGSKDDTLPESASENQGNWIQYVSLNAEDDSENPESGEGSGSGEGTGEGGDSEGGTDTDPDAEVTYATYVTEGNDLSSDVLKYFFEKAIAGAKPCLVDGSILYTADENSGSTVVNEELEKTNIFRLSAMLCQDGLSEWYEDHRNNYGSLTTKQLMDGIVEDADKNFVTEQVYCRFGDDSIINDLFSSATIYEEGGEMEPGFQPVLDEILLENLYREADTSGNYKPLSTDISQAKAVRHILNYADRRKVETKKNIKVLEIQPAKADESELTLEQLKKWAPGVETAEITVMTTSEFVGKIEKLNENYDLIYIGTSKDHLNMRYWVGDKNYTGKPDKDHIPAGTVFNDMDMDGLIYYNIGDLRGVSMPLAGQLDSEYWGGNRNDHVYYYNYVRYPGNDITEEKKDALISFLDGSYPVVVADDFFESPVTVYATPGYKDGRVNLSEGEYSYDDMVALGIAGGDISAVKVKDGYKITLYNGKNFEETGSNRYSVSFTKDESDFNNVPYAGGGNWNNKPNSLKVERIGDGVPTREIDGDHIDNCTYLYEFVEQAMEDNYVNFYAWSDITDESELFKFYLNRPKVSMTDITVNGRTKEGSDVRFIEAGINGRYNLQYSFTIRNEGAASYNTRYQCKLYIDINSDGKFSEQEEISDISMTQGGSYTSPNDLYADRVYMLTREVPSGYKGLLPWKVEITQVDNPNIYTSMQGYTKLDGMDPEQIKVIQIGRDRMTDVGWEALGWDEDLFDLGAEIRGETNYKDWTNTENYFHRLVYGGWIGDTYYEGITDDFDIDVTFHTISEFEAIYKGGVYQADGENEATYHEGNPNYLDDFNMLILGFSDMYGDFTGDAESGPMGAILDFVNGGKSVLFAHDTTSYFNYEKEPGNYAAFNGYGYPYIDRAIDNRETASHGDYHNASTLNKYLRNLVGMDRYGVLASDILKKGQPLSEGDGKFEQITNSESWRYDVAYKPKSGKTQTVPQVQGYTYLIINAKDFDHRDTGTDRTEFYEWNLDTSKTANGTFYNNYTNIRYDTVHYKGGQTDADVGRKNGEIAGNRNGEIDGAVVTQVNKGQITEYPYKLAEEFEVAETHGQYYQLDYTADDDNDGESDLVVWYCLGSRGLNGQETIYTQSPNDVRNNYYIYNKGNITYTGMGHNVHKSGKYTLEEAKLFINTIIAAYQAGVKDPYISVLKTGLPESQELKTLYRYYDPTNDFSLNNLATTETYEKIYFTVQDINFIKGSRSIASRVFYEAADGGETITVGGDEIPVNQLVVDFYNAANGSPVNPNNLQSGGIYYILVPKSFLENCESGLNLYFEAQTTLTTNTTNENVYKTEKVYAKLQVLQAYLFNLE